MIQNQNCLNVGFTRANNATSKLDETETDPETWFFHGAQIKSKRSWEPLQVVIHSFTSIISQSNPFYLKHVCSSSELV